jgi:hypothetical protein
VESSPEDPSHFREAVVRRTILTVAIALLLAGSGHPATAHESVSGHTDPRGDGLVDVWTTRRALVHVTRHHHRVRIVVHGDLYADWELEVFVDSRGGVRADYKLWAYNALGDVECGARKLFGPPIEARCDPGEPYETTVWWSIRRGLLDPDKRIRWRVVTYYPGADPYPGPPEDNAPDTGWYR